jgi:hypothetical protein
MRYFFACVLILSSLLWGCKGSKGIEYQTAAYHTSGSLHPANYTLVYALPRTTLKVSVEATQIRQYRGPYYQYAERFLGISGVIAEDNTRWILNNAEIESYQEADPEHYYSLVTNSPHVTNFFRLEKEGFVIPVNSRQFPEQKNLIRGGTGEVEEPLFTDLSIHPNVVEESRTVMRMVRQDTAFVNVPVMQRQTVTKTLEAKAAEAADLIYELRSNRFKLISGDIDLFPDGKAMEAILNEFSRLEKEYLSLFTGKIFESEHLFSFEFTPAKPANESGREHEILFRFSDDRGILPANDLSGRPVSLELTNEMKTIPLGVIQPPGQSSGEGENRLLYRVPDVANVKVTEEKRIIASKRILINQYGKIISLPADFLWE